MSNSLNKDLTGKRVILSAEYYKGDESQREFVCESGFGCVPYTNGRAIFGYFTSDYSRARIEGYEIEKLSDNQKTETRVNN